MINITIQPPPNIFLGQIATIIDSEVCNVSKPEVAQGSSTLIFVVNKARFDHPFNPDKELQGQH